MVQLKVELDTWNIKNELYRINASFKSYFFFYRDSIFWKYVWKKLLHFPKNIWPFKYMPVAPKSYKNTM